MPVSGSNNASATSPSANLTQLSNLTNAWQLDPANATQQFGLQIYGSGATTGVVIDSNSDQARQTLHAIWHVT